MSDNSHASQPTLHLLPEGVLGRTVTVFISDTKENSIKEITSATEEYQHAIVILSKWPFSIIGEIAVLSQELHQQLDYPGTDKTDLIGRIYPGRIVE